MVLLLIVGLVLSIGVEPTRQLIEQRDRIADMTTQYRELVATNAALRNRIERLHDPDFIEQRAREQGGLVRPGETAYVVMPSGRKQSRKPARRPAPTRDSPRERSYIDGLLAFVGL